MFGARTASQQGSARPDIRAGLRMRVLPRLEAKQLLNVLVAAVAGVGAVCAIASLAAGGFGQWYGVIVLVALIVLAESLAEIYFDGRLSIAFMGMVVAVMAFGPATGAIAATVVALTGFVTHGRDLKRLAFNVGQHNIAAGAASAIVAVPFLNNNVDNALVALPTGSVLALVLFVVSTLSVCTAISLNTGERIQSVYRELYSWMLPHYLGLGAVAGGLALAYEGVGIIAIVILVAPLALSQHSVRQVVEKTRDTVQRLEHSNEQLRSANAANSAILEAIPDVMYQLDPMGIVVEANAGSKANKQPTMAKGSHFADGFPARVARKVRGELAIAHRTRSIRLLEYLAENRDAETCYYEARIVPVKGGESLLMVRDISDRKRAEEARVLAEELRRTATANAPIVLFAADSTGRIELIEGHALERIPGAGEAVGRPAWSLFDDAEAVRAACKRALETDRPETISADSAGRHLEIHLSRTGGDQAHRGIIGVAVDVTERRRAQEAMVEAQKLESLGVLAGGIAHDFNNLLVGILGNADLALAEMEAYSPARKTVQEIRLAGRRAADLARQMLAYAGKGRLEMQSLDFGKLVTETASLLRSTVHRGISIDLDVPEARSFVEVDATQLRQVVMNLVVNASDAIGASGGRIKISMREEDATLESFGDAYAVPDLQGGRFVCLTVSDNGCGMDAETQSRIFDPFFTTKFSGHGLGLAAVLGIIRSHRGAIRVESEPGHGTTFTVMLPALPIAETPPDGDHGDESTWRAHGTILVVDDDAMVRRLTRRAVALHGFDVIEASDGQEAVDLYRRHPGRIAAVVIDMTMPRMSGDEAMREIRAFDPGARVVIMSGFASEEAYDRVAEQPDAFIQKPFTLETLSVTLRSVIEDSALTAAAA
jgi:PAS domain S-box-containing protein